MTIYHASAAMMLLLAAACFIGAWIQGYRAVREQSAPEYDDRHSLEGMRLRASREGYLNMREIFFRIGWGLVALAVVYLLFVFYWP